MSPIYLSLVDRVLSSEGGYNDDPADPGGETKWGISKRSYPNLDIAALTRQDAIDIYYTDFWVRTFGDELPVAIAYQVFDAAVNHGIGNALRWMQRAVGVADDGLIGPVTLQAVNKAKEDDMDLLFNAERLEFYAKLKAGDRFWRGWVNRSARNLRFAAGDTP